MDISVIVIIIILTILVCAVFYYLCNDKDKSKTSGGKLTPKQALNRYEYYLNSNTISILRDLNVIYENISVLEDAIENSYDEYIEDNNIDQYYSDMTQHSHNNTEFIIMLNDIIDKYQISRGIRNLINDMILSLNKIDYRTINNYKYNNTNSDIIKVDKINNDFTETYKYIKRNIRYIVDKLVK